MSSKVSAFVEKGKPVDQRHLCRLFPVAADLPDIVVEHVEPPWPHTSLGAKGAGEVVTTGAVGAIMNAVNDAVRLLGACINEGPMTPLRILKALRRL
jgi:CO/xanthine dehydrogenase Mo-binding subunit